MARIPYVTAETALPETREMFGKIEARGFAVANLYRMVGHTPEVGRYVLKLGNAIRFKQDLAPHLRELAILRVGQLTEAHYEWTKHVAIGLKAGVRQDQVDALGEWQAGGAFDERERAVLAYTDEVSRDVRVTDGVFAELRRLFNEREIVELTVTIGYYEMVCRLLEALQVELEV